MARGIKTSEAGQKRRNEKLLGKTSYLGKSLRSEVLPLTVDIGKQRALSRDQVAALESLSIDAAGTAIRSLASLAKINELDHLGGGLELIPSLLLTLVVSDYEKIEYTIEHAHTSVGYYAALAALGFIDDEIVVEGFRRGLDIPGHVSWLPGGTQLNGGRLGVMVPVAVGQALGKRANFGKGSWVVCHCGDAGYISGQALNGFNGASANGAPITFVMHRNGIQLSGTTEAIMDKDPRGIVAAMGVEVLETKSLHDMAGLYKVYREAYKLAQSGKPTMIYPTGTREHLGDFGDRLGIGKEVEAFATTNGVKNDTRVWVPGSLMSYRDVVSMLECIFLVNNLPGGAGHHDGHMKGRDTAKVLRNPMFKKTPSQRQAASALRRKKKRQVVTKARPAPGSRNLVLPMGAKKKVSLPPVGKSESPRAGSEAGYAAVAARFPDDVFVVSCDLDPSTKLAKARAFLKADHQFEMSIEEQAACLIINGLAMSGGGPQLNVVSTFAAFYEGIAREGFDMWRYQRNLTGVNEGVNAAFHVSHVGACTGRDHFSGWGLDWINIGLCYLPYMHRFYAPSDARSAFLAVCDMAAHYGAHVIGIPRDSLPTLEKQHGSGPLWEAGDEWEAVTAYRSYPKAQKAILAMGAPAFLAGQAADKLGGKVDVHIVNGLPLAAGALEKLVRRYPRGVVTIEDGLIGGVDAGLRGFAAFVAGVAAENKVPATHVGITDPTTAPSEGHMETWAHFGLTAQALVAAAKGL